MAYCSKCGKELKKDETFCSNCGNNIKGEFTPMNNQQIVYVKNETNGFAIAGFVLSFLVPLLGLIFSCIGLSKAKAWNDNGKGLSVAGIIISALFIILAIVIVILAVIYGDYTTTRYRYY
jgi:uncharacterized membrane protein YvbJ